MKENQENPQFIVRSKWSVNELESRQVHCKISRDNTVTEGVGRFIASDRSDGTQRIIIQSLALSQHPPPHTVWLRIQLEQKEVDQIVIDPNDANRFLCHSR